ncbi:MAG: efflux RND transporter periplasmic adaptor subunit, partial [Candidatus Acidiferrales bacterium]
MNRRSQSSIDAFLFRTIPAAFVFAIVGASLFGCSSEKPAETVSPETVSGVPVITVHKTEVPDWLEAMGTVRAEQSAEVSSQMMGNIREIRAREGDRVQAGQILATIDDSQPRAAVESAAAVVTAAEKEVAAADSDYGLAQSTLKRYQQLFDRKSVSPQEFDEIKAREQAAESRRDMARAGEAQANAALTQARTALGYAEVHAPFSGVVTEKKADAGALAYPCMPLFTLEDTRSYRLEVNVDESNIRIVRPGQSVPISLDAQGSSGITGRVQQIVPAADSASRSFLVKIGLP